MFKFIKEMDFLGKGINFKVTEKGNNQTFYGGFLSLIYYAFFIYFTIIFGYNMFIIRFPQGYSQIKPGFYSGSEKLNFTDEPFIGGFRVESDDGQNLDISDFLFPIFMHYYENKHSGKFEFTRLKTIRCHKTISSKFLTKAFVLEEYFCPDLSEIPDITVKVIFSDE